ncbi:putative Uncharacterized membrane protein [Glarea lozoyensis 74030]|uniref:Putative Uncharacterized membrane protein n=1 Tax=Glarea lozoyensis (strain ATCC 74030 / MF5533) TaxID=1104152 RepID=H0EVV9_GLAL7|nr:putative Uncharacterized membrane protein [Glarea lozoyensis 74030]
MVSVIDDTQKVEDESPSQEDSENSVDTKEKSEPAKTVIHEPVFRKVLRIFGYSKVGTKSNDGSSKKVTLKSLTDRKAKLRAKLGGCKAAQQECNFELAYAVLPPELLKPISVTAMTKLVANTIALIGACESKYALMGDENDKIESDITEAAKAADVESENSSSKHSTDEEATDNEHSKDRRRSPIDVNGGRKSEKNHDENGKKHHKGLKRKSTLQQGKENLELIKPKKEIEFGDVELLRYLVGRIADPLRELQKTIDASVGVITSCLAYSYDVPKLPLGAPTPAGIQLQEIDIRIDVLTDALTEFDKNSAEALQGAASIRDLEHLQVDVMPRMETFLISLFLLNLRQSGLHTLEMLRHSRIVLERRQARHKWRRLYAPQINWRKWLASGGEEDMLALPDNARKEVRTGKVNSDDEDGSSFTRSDDGLLRRTDLESTTPLEVSEDSRNGGPKPDRKLQKTAPKPKQPKSFISRARNGLADIVEYLHDSDDVIYAIKLAVAVYLVTWPAFVASWNTWYSLNRGLWAALQLVLITEVAIGTSVWTFLLRAFGTSLGCLWGYAAYQAGSGNHVVLVILLVVGIIPSAYVQLGSQYVKAGMVSIISMCIVCLATTSRTVPGTATENYLKRFIAFLIGGVVALIVQFTFVPVKARDRLVESLAASITQIIEMEACLAYGVETVNNVDVHSTAVTERFDQAKAKAQGALAAADTFLPFCANEPRLKGSFKGLALVYAEISMDNMIHLRYEYGSGVLEELNAQSAMEVSMVKRVIRQKFLSWNAASAGQIEVIEFLEELIDLAKLLVGANEFRNGMLTRPTYREYIERMDKTEQTWQHHTGNASRTGEAAENDADTDKDEALDIMPEPATQQTSPPQLRKRPTFSRRISASDGKKQETDEEKLEKQRLANCEELPRSLQRVRSRRIEEMNLQRYGSNEEGKVKSEKRPE